MLLGTIIHQVEQVVQPVQVEVVQVDHFLMPELLELPELLIQVEAEVLVVMAQVGAQTDHQMEPEDQES